MSFAMIEALAIEDSGPLIALARINRLSLLPQLCSRILFPPAVWNEVTVLAGDAPGAREVSQAEWIEIKFPDSSIVKQLQISVDLGESEAIALAQSFPGCLPLVDDARARREAERLNIRRIGTVGLLRRAKQSGLINSLRAEIEALQSKGIYIHQSLIDSVLQEVGE
jgi:uncharacterized protein